MNRLQRHRSTPRSIQKLALSLCLVASFLAVVTTGRFSTPAGAQNVAATARAIQGKVFAAAGQPKAGAVVYLKDEKSLEIKTYISGSDGTYRFGQLSSQEDYLLWAEADGHKTKNKNISSFDSKKTFFIDLHLEDK